MVRTLPGIRGFDWDEGNRDKNLTKHDVSNGECEEVFLNEPLVVIDDPKHSEREARYTALGITDAGRKLTIVFTLRSGSIRVVSARDVHRKERSFYEEHS